MASPARQRENIRKRRDSKKGTARKAALRTNGSTPSEKELFGDKN